MIGLKSDTHQRLRGTQSLLQLILILLLHHGKNTDTQIVRLFFQEPETFLGSYLKSNS